MIKKAYSKMPWSDLDTYFELGMKYNLWGIHLKEYLVKENRKTRIPEPKIGK